LQYPASSHILREEEGLQKVTAKVIDGTRLIGYARVSSDDQNLDMQIDALERAECEIIYKDGGISGVKHRPALTRALKDLQPGDTFIFWKLDRLGRGALDLLSMLEDFEKRGINLKSLTEPIDTTTAMGKAFYGIAAVFAELFRTMNKENQTAGIAAAKRRGKHLGRPRKLTPEQIRYAQEQIAAEKETPTSMASIFNVDPTTVWRALKRAQNERRCHQRQSSSTRL
jgi:DNA invertase Pin-like site-specific DNA recombinase